MANKGNPDWIVTPQAGYQINSTAISEDGTTCLLGTSQEYGTGNFAVFCYATNGILNWQDPLGEKAYQGVFWVALSASGNYAAAGGTISQTKMADGFLRAYHVSSGEILLDEQALSSRVNQVALSDQGDVLVAVAGSMLHVYALNNNKYQKLVEHELEQQYCRCCAISAAGTQIVVGTSTHSETETDADAEHTPDTGMVALFELREQILSCVAKIDTDARIMHVAMLADGSWWVAARSDGKAMAFTAEHTRLNHAAVWTCGAQEQNLDVAYGIAVARTQDGTVRVVCGANLENAEQGCLYAIYCRSADSPGSSTAPMPLWQYKLKFDPNPGINMDRAGQWVTATDGQPETGVQESPGHFYLFAASSGEPAWCYSTPLMNWPMAISASGNAVFGGSDDGSAYYWLLQ